MPGDRKKRREHATVLKMVELYVTQNRFLLYTFCVFQISRLTFFFKLISAKEPVLAKFELRSSAGSFRVSSWPPRPPHGVPDQGGGRAPSDSCHRASAQACALGEGPTTNGVCAGLFWVCLPRGRYVLPRGQTEGAGGQALLWGKSELPSSAGHWVSPMTWGWNASHLPQWSLLEIRLMRDPASQRVPNPELDEKQCGPSHQPQAPLTRFSIPSELLLCLYHKAHAPPIKDGFEG